MDHIEAKHNDCLFCSAEWLLIRSILEKKGEVWWSAPGHGTMLSKVPDRSSRLTT
jgi:hypothetical protein